MIGTSVKRKRESSCSSTKRAKFTPGPLEGTSHKGQRPTVKQKPFRPGSSSNPSKEICKKSKHLQGSSVKRRIESPSCSSAKGPKLTPEHLAGNISNSY
ncbi:uncharacterized protein LOC144665807 isoform X2 [Oculina patagonica]